MQYCNKAWCINGAAALLGTIALLGLGVFLFITGAMAFDAGRAGGPLLAPGVVCLFPGCLAPTSLTIVQPGQTKVVQFFGNHVGTIRKAGLLMTVPFSSKKNVSVRVNNFETNELKANDIETRISALAYAPEIAQAMLQRQQASAVIAAREKIVEGAVSMVETALTRLETENVVNLDDERKAAMVSNLLVVLCGESRATPVVNTGSLYT